MALYMPPIARKKRVPEKYNPDTFRVVSMDAEVFHPKFPDAIIKPVYDSDPRPARRLLPGIPIRETRIVPHTTYDFRAHNPHPVSCGFLRHDARLLNEPICTVFTRRSHPEQHLWWPSRTSSEVLEIPAYTHDTIYRKDFQFASDRAPKGSSRHTANPNTDPALGSVPVNFLRTGSGAQRLYQEGLSFEHQYDSRADPNYPVRSKRHGAFVWDQVKPDKAELLLDYHESVARRKAEEEVQVIPQQTGPSDPVPSPPVPQTQAPDTIPGELTPPITKPPDIHLAVHNTKPFVDTHPVLPDTQAPSADIHPGSYTDLPSPLLWPYPQVWQSPSPPYQEEMNTQGEITPDDFQRANLQAGETIQKDMVTST